jgi:hypothetical protein
MSCGTQVIATDIPPLRETLGRAASFYDTEDRARLAWLAEQAFTGVLPDRAAAFVPPSWADSGAAVVHSLRQALAEVTGRTTPPAGVQSQRV